MSHRVGARAVGRRLDRPDARLSLRWRPERDRQSVAVRDQATAALMVSLYRALLERAAIRPMPWATPSAACVPSLAGAIRPTGHPSCCSGRAADPRGEPSDATMINQHVAWGAEERGRRGPIWPPPLRRFFSWLRARGQGSSAGARSAWLASRRLARMWPVSQVLVVGA